MSISPRHVIVVALAALVTGCVSAPPVVVDEPPPGPPGEPPGRSEGLDRIPPGHSPPPGMCRIWYPGEPPGHQPPAGRCDELRLKVPVGAWLVYNPGDDRPIVRLR